MDTTKIMDEMKIYNVLYHKVVAIEKDQEKLRCKRRKNPILQRFHRAQSV